MEIVIGLLPLLLYMGTGAALILPFARYFRDASTTSYDGPLYFAFMGWVNSLVWPVTGLIFGIAYLMKADERKEEERKAKELSLAEAYKIVEAARQAERGKERALMREWEQAAGMAMTPPRNKTTSTGWYPSRGIRKDYDK